MFKKNKMSMEFYKKHLIGLLVAMIFLASVGCATVDNDSDTMPERPVRETQRL